VALVFEVLGVLFSGLALASLGPRTGSRRAPVLGVLLVVAGVTGLLFFSNAWTELRSFRSQTRADSAIPKQQALVAGGAGTNTAFFAWARGQITMRRAAASYYPFLGPNVSEFLWQWSTYKGPV
jgi:hypothetical protein